MIAVLNINFILTVSEGGLTKKCLSLLTALNIILFLIIGAVAGWLAGKVMKGKGFGLVGNLIVGIVGALIGGFVFDLLGIYTGSLIGALITAFVGAVILLWIVQLIKK